MLAPNPKVLYYQLPHLLLKWWDHLFVYISRMRWEILFLSLRGTKQSMLRYIKNFKLFYSPPSQIAKSHHLERVYSPFLFRISSISDVSLLPSLSDDPHRWAPWVHDTLRAYLLASHHRHGASRDSADSDYEHFQKDALILLSCIVRTWMIHFAW